MIDRGQRTALAVLAVSLLGGTACGGGGATAEAVPNSRSPGSGSPTAEAPTEAPTGAPTGVSPPGSSSGTAAPSDPVGSGGDGGGRWRPSAQTTWQYQLGGSPDLTVDAEVFDVDWEETTAAQVQQLHAMGRRVICYVNAGAFEDWRPDAGAYPDDVLGAPLDDWEGERWVDIRRLDVLLPIIAARMDVCRDKGFDAVEPDNLDGYQNDPGFDLTAEDQIRFNEAVAGLAHERGMSVGLKNDVEQVARLEPSFDFAVNEECLAYDECDSYRPFLAAGKAVLHVEYTEPTASLCSIARTMGLNTIFKDVELGAPLRRC